MLSRILSGWVKYFHTHSRGFDLRLVPEKLTEPFAWRSPKLVFVNSMSDLFQPGVSDKYVEAVSQVLVAANWHTYQVLTKRSERLRDLLQSGLGVAAEKKNIWWGVSVEDRKYGLPRIEHLRDTPASVRFLSIEPLLEDLDEINLTGISWVIVGGESGHGARPLKKEWVLSIRDQCKAFGIPFFFKQWGGVRKTKNGRLLEGHTYSEYPSRASTDVPDKSNCAAFAETFLNSFRGLTRRSSLVQVG
jgi:protein gp37